MTTIRMRISLLLLFFAVTTAAIAFAAHLTYRDYRAQRDQLESSWLLRDQARDFTYGKTEGLSVPLASLSPERRRQELTDLLASRDARNFGERQRVFLSNEKEFQRFTREQMNYLEKRLQYLAVVLLINLLVCFLSLPWLVSRAVIGPIHDLSRKMVDFVHDRYTYQFSVPSHDEIGHMQATFNSLAQRVISNMEQLRTLDEAKSEFLSIASHELRTPLTSIKGSLGLMRSGVVGKMNEMTENLLTIAENETDRLIRLINDILDLAKIEARKLPLHQEWSSLNTLTSVTIESLQGLATQAEVELRAAQMPPLDVHMDKDRVQQVLTNLLSNAIKFSPKGQPVIVHVEPNQRGELVIEVRDRGRGIDPQDQEAIFQKFRQATSAKNPLVKGTGLGLAIARALVEQHGGEIGVRLVPGEGSTFYFTLSEWRYRAENTTEAIA